MKTNRKVKKPDQSSKVTSSSSPNIFNPPTTPVFVSRDKKSQIVISFREIVFFCLWFSVLLRCRFSLNSLLQLVLEEIIGLTTKNCNGLASNISTTKCAYVAGCVVVVYDVESGSKSHLMVLHRMPKPLSCVALSSNGRFIAAGEVRITSISSPFCEFFFFSVYVFERIIQST